ncbi:MAG: nitroreductase family protein [Planctomycetia bacterium]|nr:nitroreductase family protein [Planctomycetia bacterium]
MKLDAMLCRRCGVCVAECPAHLFYRQANDEVPQILNPDGCIHCGHCMITCPADAITEEADSSISTPLPLPAKVADWECFYGLLQTRRSVRQYQKKPVPRELLEKIIATAELAPTATNQRKVCWTVVTRPETIQELRRRTMRFLTSRATLLRSPIAKFLARIFPHGVAGSNMRYLPFLEQLLERGEVEDWILFDAPAVLVAHYDGRGGRFADTDAQLAIQNATLAAVALGLGTFYTGFVTMVSEMDRGIGEVLGYPAGHRMAGGMTVGYPAVAYRGVLARAYPETRWIE